jgi:hypothetical protein
MSSRDLLATIATSMKKKPSDFDKYADILEGEFLEEAEGLKDVSEDQWK